MTGIALSALSDIAFALHDACARFSPPLVPDQKEVMTAVRKGKKFAEAQDSAKLVPRQMNIYDIDAFEMFQQTWGSTALGFGGMGGAAMTTANTTVVFYRGQACIYFGARFAYRVERTPELTEDIAKKRVAPVVEHSKYNRK